MAVSTDLTNTTWIFNNNPDMDVEGGLYSINFISNNTSYTEIRFGEIGNYRLLYNSTSAYRSGTWNNENYKTIEINGGTDSTNSTLISWLESNATQITLDDLTNTTWLINNNPSITGSYGVFNINISCDDITTGGSYIGLAIGYSFSSYAGGGEWVDGTSAFLFYQFESSSINGYTLTFTGGDDAENISLIAWLEANATQITVEDLTGTKWIINDTPDWFSSTSYEIDFVTNNGTEEYNEIQSVIDHGNLIYYLPAQQSSAIWDTSNGWLDSAYKTIEITGGTDSTNMTLIGWLTQNATQVIAPTKTYKLGWRLKSATLISFTVRSISYQAEDGMTWQQWVNSEYNTPNFIIDDNYVKTSALGLWVGLRANIPVRPTDTILADTTYGAYGGGEN